MEVEVTNSRQVVLPQAPNFSVDVTKAEDLLLYRNFLECLNVCQKSVRIAKTYPEVESANKAVEDLCILAIQAYAELNRWQEVLPFINQVYEGIENCPATIIQVCLLLYSKVKDYTTCHAISLVWLKHARKHEISGYEKVVEIVIAKVLIPQNKWTDISGFIDTCDLTKEKKRHYLAITKEYHAEFLEKRRSEGSCDAATSTDRGFISSKEVPGSEPSPGATAIFKHYLQRFRQFIVRNIPVANLKTAKCLAFMGLSVYMIFYAAHSDMIGNMTRMAALWQGMVTMWRRLFAPYHISRSV